MNNTFEEKVIQVLEEWQWEPAKEKIEIELDPKVNRFSTLLFSYDNWETIYKILRNCVNNGKYIYISNYFRPLEDIKRMVIDLYQKNYDYILDFLAKYVEQYKNINDEDANKLNEILNSFLYDDIFEETPEVLEYCQSCEKIQIVGEKQRDERCMCDSRIYKIFKCVLNPNIKKSLQNNQFIEIYVKEIFKEASLKVISKRVNGSVVSTSIPYKVPPNPPVELDVVAVYNDWIFLCECKTKKIIPNDVANKLGQANRLVKRISKQIGVRDLNVIYVWVTTEEIDKNIHPSGYLEDYEWLKDLLFIDKDKIINLKDEIRKKLISF